VKRIGTLLFPAASALLILFPAICTAAVGGVTPYVTDNFVDLNQSAQIWNINGNVQLDSYALATSDTGGASLISTVAVPDGTHQYQIDFYTGLGGMDNPGGTYVLYLEATTNALLNLNGTSSGSFYAFAISSFAGQNGCQAQVTLYKSRQRHRHTDGQYLRPLRGPLHRHHRH
jgi:hypothetical protein